MGKRSPMRGLIRLSVLLASLSAAPFAHATYIGQNLFGAWTSATADTLTNTSGPSEQTPDGPAPNGLHSANVYASAGNGNGAATGQGFANVGLLGGNASASGCLAGNFQQPCISGSTYSEFYDTVQITGAAPGTQVSITFTLSTVVNVMGFGAVGWQTRFTDGFNQVENSESLLYGAYSGDFPQAHSWTATYTVGSSYGLSGWLNLGVSEENCPGGSQNCGAANSLFASVTTWVPTAKIAHCPQCRIQSASGFAYLQATQNHPFASLHTFAGTDGATPAAGLAQATDGNLYGTTQFGGTAAAGTVFKISRAGALKTLYSFCSLSNCQDGEEPTSGLVQGTDGNLYGTTEFGGTAGLGSVFKMSRTGLLSTLYSFSGGTGGSVPATTLVQGADGKFYGTTDADGTHLAGTFFRVSRTGAFKALHSFDATNGANQNSGLIQARDGNFYGTTYAGGAQSAGTVFKIDASGVLTTLYEFCSKSACADGRAPAAGLLQGADGNFYGTTAGGGANDDGTVFSITAAGTLTTLHSFSSGDGANLVAGLIQATDGNLYGTTSQGGAHNGGTVFRVTPSGGFASLYSFCAQADCADGSMPTAPLIQDTDGDLYGTTTTDATGFGTIFRLSVGLGPFVATQTQSGTVGATVVLLGTDLTGATSVTFNGTPATAFTVVSKSEIKATIPVGASTGPVLVVTPGGTLSSNQLFTVD